MSLRFIDWIWSIRGSLALAPDQSAEEAFGRLDPLFRQTGTSCERTNNVLSFSKKDQAAQDKMSIFDEGMLRIEQGEAEPVLRYRLTSRILLFCFLAPLLFLALAQLTIVAVKLQKPAAEATGKAAKKDAAEKKASIPMNPIDKALGAPAPDKPDKKNPKKGGRDRKPTPTAGYVFAGIFATLYVVGRVLEDRLVKTLFRKRLFAS